MKSIRRVIAGGQSKRRGEAFENILRGSAYRTHWTVIRIPDGCRQLGGGKLVRVRSPFDFVFVKKDRPAIFADAKCTTAKSFRYSAIDPHQLKSLKDIHDQGHLAGYIINFQELRLTVFFDGLTIARCRSQTSLKPEDGQPIGNNEIILLDRLFSDPKNDALQTIVG